jgi:hypothetical protein
MTAENVAPPTRDRTQAGLASRLSSSRLGRITIASGTAN